VCSCAVRFNQPGGQFCNGHGIDFEYFTQVVEVLRFLRGKAPRVSAAASFNTDQAFRMKGVESLPDGRFALMPSYARAVRL
jgi:hypothetical protein